METIEIISLSLAGALMLSFTPSNVATWKADTSHVGLNFTVVHFGVSDIYGTFDKIDAKFTSSTPDYSDAIFEFEADINSISTNEAQRDAHLKSPDFFDAAKYSTATFKSTGIKKLDGTKYKITGDLSMHGVTNPIELNAVIANGTNVRLKKEFVAVKITGTVNRSSFGIGPSIPNVMISDEVIINGSGEFMKD